MSMTVLVTGATGNVGRHVVSGLLSAGVAVRALTRDPASAGFPADVEVVEGDLERPKDLSEVFTGVDRMYLFPVPETAREVVAEAESAGVGRIVVLSSDAVTEGLDPGLHTRVEAAVEASGLEWTHVRPGEFALNKIDFWGRSVQSEGTARLPYPEARGAPVHEADVADVAVAALLENGHVGHVYGVSGPELLTQREQVRAIGIGLGREIACVEISPEQARRDLVDQGVPGFAADHMLSFQARWAERPPRVYAAPREITGRPARTLAQWAADHVTDFL